MATIWCSLPDIFSAFIFLIFMIYFFFIIHSTFIHFFFFLSFLASLIDLSLSLYIYIYIYICVCVCFIAIPWVGENRWIRAFLEWVSVKWSANKLFQDWTRIANSISKTITMLSVCWCMCVCVCVCASKRAPILPHKPAYIYIYIYICIYVCMYNFPFMLYWSFYSLGEQLYVFGWITIMPT